MTTFQHLYSLHVQLACLTLASGLVSSAMAKEDPKALMIQGALVWAAEKRGVQAEDLAVAPLDARLVVPACPAGWAADFPFSNMETIRMRCSKPAAQIYLRVSARLSADTAGKATTAARPATAEPEADQQWVVVLRQGLLRGTRLNESHLERVQVERRGLPGQALDSIEAALDGELTRDIRAGQPLSGRDLRPAVLVKRGQIVTLSTRQSSGFSVNAQVEALQDGRRGESIRLKNRESGRILTGVVSGNNLVELQ